MLGTKQQTWLAVDIGGRWIKCACYVSRHGHVREVGSQVIDIQTEGLLSSDEVAAAIAGVMRSMGEHPLTVVLPQNSAVSQVIDLPDFTAGDRSGELEEEVLELTGLRADRCVYDSEPLEPRGGFTRPRWVTVAKEEDLSRYLSPLLGQGLRVEAATTAGNALVAAFRESHPEVENASLIDLGATQTTLIRLRKGEPVQMASLTGGGEAWTEVLLAPGGAAFEELEARLFREDAFADPLLGGPLRDAVRIWQNRVLKQFEEWREESHMPDEDASEAEAVYLFGGYSAIRGLSGVLTRGAGLSWKLPRPVGNSTAPVWLPNYGAVLMATGASAIKASVLPRPLAKMREHRRKLARLTTAVFYLFLLVAAVLGLGIFKQQTRLERFGIANREANETLAEIEAAAKLLEQADALRVRIEPVVDGRLNSRDSLETFRRVQQVQEQIDFTLIRFVDRQTYFLGMEGGAEPETSSERAEADPGPGPSDLEGKERPGAFVVELTIAGEQAERLQVLGDVVGRLRKEEYFANVDRLLDRTEGGSGVAVSEEDESYALLLTLSREGIMPNSRKKGAGR